MKAAQILEYGGPDALQINDVPVPEISDEQVLIEVRAASINPWDTTVREGHVKDTMPLNLPVTLGGDLAGVVKKAGDRVTNFHEGDKVYGQTGQTGGNTGAFAEMAAVKADEIAHMPSNLDFTGAAAVPLTGVSALQVLVDHLKLQAGQKILIHGGAGGIGTIAIQIAKHIGAYVATTATGEGLEYVKQLGADEVIDYKTQQFEDLLSEYDAVFDTVAGDTYDRSFKVLKKGGIIVSMNVQPKQELMDQYGVTAIFQSTHVTTGDLDTLRGYIEDGTVTVHVDKTFALEEIAEAFRARENGSVRGKVVIATR